MNTDDLKAEIARLRPHYQSNTATDQARRQLLDHFEKFAATHAADPAPAAVEGLQGPTVEWVKNHPETAAKIIKNQANRIHGFAPTGNTALVEAAQALVDACKEIRFAKFPSREEYIAIDSARGAVISAIATWDAALSQPAAPQPTPEVEALVKKNAELTGLINAALHGQATDDLEWQIDARAALARGSVAEKGGK